MPPDPHVTVQDPHQPGGVGTEVPTDLGHPRRWAVLAVLCLAVFVTVLDGTIVNVALPSLSLELGRIDPPAAVDRRRLPAGVHRAAAGGRRAGRQVRPQAAC